MLFTSAEIRWFHRGDPPPELIAWFEQSFTSTGHDRRTDHYLKGTGEALNVKLREGRVEVKQRQWARPGFVIRRTITGQMEGWRKWSFDLSAGQGYLNLAEQHPDSWLEVRKYRRMRTFIPEIDEITETSPGSYPPIGCNAELTHLEVAETSWHTLAFEAFGKTADLSGWLHSVAEYLLNGDFPVLLDEETSMGYAQWIEANFRDRV